MIYLTADLHLGHANIIKLCDRPFSDVKRMDSALIAAINDRVSATDELWVLGDFANRATAKQVRKWRRSIVCRHVHLIHGNHDVHMTEGEREGVFEHDLGYFDQLRSPGRRRMVMCHYPILDWNGQTRGSYMLHGHVHSKADANERNREAGLLRYDVGVDANGYAPVSIEEVEAFFEGVEPAHLHH
jgi:calcineurin-like phosphoesterase family protein